MKLRHVFMSLFVTFLSVGAFSLALNKTNINQIKEVDAVADRTFVNGNSGEVMYVSGSQGVFSGGNLAVYFYNTTVNAWTDKITRTCNNGTFMVPIPYYQGNPVQWTNFIITRYDSSKSPFTDGWGGVLAQSADLSISIFSVHGQNCIQMQNADLSSYLLNLVYYYGVKSGSILYLDLTELPEWENDYAKLSMYFAAPNRETGSAWSTRFSADHTYQEPAFCHPVKGQDNPHLYQCIVPQNYGKNCTWGMVIGVRQSKDAIGPSFDDKWNQTADLYFNSTNHESNIIRVTKNGDDWSGGGKIIEPKYAILDQTRAGFYGQYFIDTVACSGDGNSDATTSEMWGSVENEYKQYLSDSVEGILWLSSTTGEDLVSKAMKRYDYIVFYKQYDHNDFINRAESEGKSYFSPSIAQVDNSNDFTIGLFVLIGVTTIGFTSILIIKKKHHNI